VMGNKEPVRKDHLIKYLEHLLEIQA